MKKYLTLVVLLMLFCTSFAFAKNKQEGEFMNGKKILIAYFSWSGNTKSIAEKIHNTTGGDMFQIETVTPYPNDYHETAYVVAKKEHEENIKPKLKDNGDVSKYDVIFVGTPAWWYGMAPAVKTFLSENNFDGKIIVPFVTHGGGGGYTIDKDMQEMTKGSKVLKPFVVSGRGGANVQEDINTWLKGLE